MLSGERGTQVVGRRTAAEVRDTGITQLYAPEGEAVADVIFVHGLQSHPRKTWSCHPKADPKSSRSWCRPFSKGLSGKAKASSIVEDPEYWPEQLLPEDNNNVRVLTYGYDSNVTKGYIEPNSKNNIFAHGRSFLWAVDRYRRKCLGRPIIFVAHSLGGLVVKQALIEARKQEDHNSQLYDVYQCSYAIIFLGTPHRGSSIASWGVILSSVAKAVQIDSNQKVIKDLIPDGSSKLEELILDFNDILNDRKRSRRLKLFTFQEELGISGFRFVGRKEICSSSSYVYFS
jgi:hypothetical protein